MVADWDGFKGLGAHSDPLNPFHLAQRRIGRGDRRGRPQRQKPYLGALSKLATLNATQATLNPEIFCSPLHLD